MFGLSPTHILIFGIVALLFGSKRLPELGAGLGKGIRAFKGVIDGQSADETLKITKDSSEVANSPLKG